MATQSGDGLDVGLDAGAAAGVVAADGEDDRAHVASCPVFGVFMKTYKPLKSLLNA